MANTLPEPRVDDLAQCATALRLPSELTIYTAAETRGTWLAWLAGDAGQANSDQPLCAVDASACDEIDAAGAQLLVALANSLALQHRQLQLQQPSSPVRQACVDLGLDGWLLPQTAAEATA